LQHRTLNLGILAHVDAGKTTLTERLLYAAGVIDEVGSVDHGTTQTDYLALERERGITIRSAVVSFEIDDVTVNLIDTPGHPDFIAEVERVLSVLDGAVLVVSAVEGVQSQTRILMRALQRLRVPTLVFVNKIDRAGAGDERTLESISSRLTPAIVPLGEPSALGTRAADFTPWDRRNAAFVSKLTELLAEQNEVILAAYVEGTPIAYRLLREELALQTSRALVHPVVFGSAITGAGVKALTDGIAELLPAASREADGPVSATVFKIERGEAGDRIAYVRMFSGTIGVRDRVRFGRGSEGKVTALRVFDNGRAEQRSSVAAGEIGQLWGLAEVQIGDSIGEAGTAVTHHFPPPAFETVVIPGSVADMERLRVALNQLAEQDPLIDVRQDDERHELSVSLYGDVQKEVIQATLARDFGVDVAFRELTLICIERPAGVGEAVEILHGDSNPFAATIGLRVAPAPVDSGIEFRLEVDHRSVPMYAYRTIDRFADSMEEYVRRTLQEGLYGWQVGDCTVTMTDCTYQSPDGPPSTQGPLSKPADFRKLTPLVLMQALERAGTLVCEPILRVRLEFPAAAIGAVLALLSRLGVAAQTPSVRGDLAIVETALPAARAQDLRRQLPGATSGEGVVEAEFGGYEPVAGTPPTRPRTTANPLNRDEYLLELARRVTRP
jgi:ribosomal protection tetracycline resistance protein